MIKYHFPFAFEYKERERARVLAGRAVIYSPKSTKDFYKKVRDYMFLTYPYYEKQKIDFACKLTMTVAMQPHKDKGDLDNILKNLDSLLPDRTRKNNSGFKGIYKDDSLIKWVEIKLYYVDDEKDEFTTLVFEPHSVEVLNG
jgi:Holliday junction resolvase RusA-like endonuclease